MAATTVGTIQVIATMNTSNYEKGVSKIDSENKRMESSTTRSTSRMGNVLSTMSKVGWAAMGAAAAAATGLIVSNLGNAIKRVDTLNNAPRVLQNLGFSAKESAEAIRGVDKGARGLPTSLDNIASSLVSVASASGLGLKESTALTIAFNNMALAGGKGPLEAERAFVQFTQALGRGKFQAQDFNTLMEVMPAQLNQVAKSLLGPEANAMQLREALSSGEVTMGQFNTAVMRLDKEGGKGFASFSKQARTATDGIGTSITNATTSIVRGIGDVIETVGSGNISNAIGNFGKNFEGALKGVSKWIKDNKELAEIFATTVLILGGAFIAASVGVAIFNAVTAPYVAIVASIIAGVTLLVAGLIWLEKKTKIFSNAWNGMMEAIQPVIEWFKANILPTLQQIGNFIAQQFMTAWNNLSTAFSGLMSALQPLMPILQIIGAILLGALLVPIGIVVGAIVGFIAVVTGIITVFNWLWNVASTVFTAIWNVISTVFNAIMAVYNATLAPVFSLIGTVIKAVFTIVVAVLTALFSIWSAIFQGIFKVVSSVFNAIWGVISPVLNKIWGFIKPILDRIGNTFKTVFNNIKNFVSDSFNNVVKFVTKFVNVGKDMIDGLKRGITNGAEAVKNAVLDIAKGAEKAIKNFFGIKSPSRMFADIGNDLMRGLSQGITGGAGAVVSAMEGVNTSLASTAAGTLSAPSIAPISASGFDVDTSEFSSGGASRQTTIGNIYLANDVDADRFLRKLSGDQEITSAGLVPNQEYM